ncbi:toll/interleukin-1 receptor domain-containing protein [Parvularcula sp. ZS-1/3]|uniref:Toll/interleukin-1 receptor domain-containing protein n=1 Tax=Parvularcula mediterranea TaxID=2732508 RepID=A0A7Y3W5L0_9PROT|nr:toll/interleukin-1 receptor domain-containing protein [Parvularcula mediterranea]
MSQARQYKAFISYAHKDKREAQSLHLRLETFRTPKNIIGTEGRFGPVERRLTPVFRDRDELSSSSELAPALEEALTNSEFLIVLCSPASANSVWANEEIRRYRSIHGDERVLAAIVGGDPGAEVGEGKPGCFPPALVAPPEGSDKPREPIAADFRPEGDGRKLAFQKLASGMLGVGLDQLTQRMAQRRQRRMAQAAGLMGVLSVAMGGLAVYAFQQEALAEEQQAIAERERDIANASSEFLVSIFEVANPATENPKTITALTVIERGFARIDEAFAEQPEVQAKLLADLGRVYASLGEIDTAKDALNRAIAAPGVSVQDRLAASTRLANLLYLTNSNEEASALAGRVLEELDGSGYDADDRHLIGGEALEVLANIAAYRDYDKQAGIDRMLQAIDHYTLSGEGGTRQLARAQTQLGTMYSYADESDLAIDYLSRAITNLERFHGPNHINVANGIQNRGLVEFRAGRTEQAARSIEEALVTYNRVLEPSHPNLARTHLLHGRILAASGNFAGSEEAMRKAIAGFEAAYGPNHEEIAITRIYLGQFQANEGLIEDAFASFDEAKSIYDTLFPPDHANHGDLLVYRAIAINASGDKTAALEACDAGLEIMRATVPQGDAWLEENEAICEDF